MITDLVVYLSLGLTLGFVVAWALRPDLRAWVERPKHLFLQNVRRYDHRTDISPGTNSDND